MNIRKMIRFSVKGVPIIPLASMSIVVVAAVLVATLPIVSNSLTINAAPGLFLYTFAGGVCSTSPVSSITWSSFTTGASVPVNQTGAVVCLSASSSATTIFVGAVGTNPAYTVTAGAPSGLAIDLYAQTGGASLGGSCTALPYNQALSPYTYKIASGSSTVQNNPSGNQCISSWALRLIGTTSASAGAYSWTVTINAYTTATG